MIRIIGQTRDFHAIRFVQAIRKASGLSLKDGLDHVRRLSEGEILLVVPDSEFSDQEVASWLEDCGVTFDILPSE